jgi:replicative DNA helicase
MPGTRPLAKPAPTRQGRLHSANGRVPPHDLQAEESLIGAMLLSRDAIAAAVETCKPEDFYRPAHGYIFDAICSLYAQGAPADPVTVADELRRADLLGPAGGPGNLVALQADTPAISNAHRYARIVAEHALLRRLIGAASEIAELGYSLPEDVAGALDRAEAIVFDIAERHVTDSTRPLHELLSAAVEHLENLQASGDTVTGVPTGYRDLDQKLSGLQPGSLVIVGARPSMGKTSFALGAAAHAATEKRLPVLFFSLEMSHLELTQRLLCTEAKVDSSRLRDRALPQSDWPKLMDAITELAEAPLFIDDNPSLSVMEIRAKARRLKSRAGLGLVVVDYLQLMSTRNGSPEYRQFEVAEVSRGLKVLARELDVPVLALSQLSRALEGRSDKRPMLADLRESGSLEQDADVVLFIYRDEVYSKDPQAKGLAEVIVAKHRNGPTGTVQLAFLDRFTRFVDLARPASTTW